MSVSLVPQNYTILDFCNNTIYVDRSESVEIDGVTCNILCFITMDKGINNVSIRNLIITGKPSYGAFLAKAYNVLFKNVTIAVVKDETYSTGIGIRSMPRKWRAKSRYNCMVLWFIFW